MVLIAAYESVSEALRQTFVGPPPAPPPPAAVVPPLTRPILALQQLGPPLARLYENAYHQTVPLHNLYLRVVAGLHYLPFHNDVRCSPAIELAFYIVSILLGIFFGHLTCQCMKLEEEEQEAQEFVGGPGRGTADGQLPSPSDSLRRRNSDSNTETESDRDDSSSSDGSPPPRPPPPPPRYTSTATGSSPPARPGPFPPPSNSSNDADDEDSSEDDSGYGSGSTRPTANSQRASGWYAPLRYHSSSSGDTVLDDESETPSLTPSYSSWAGISTTTDASPSSQLSHRVASPSDQLFVQPTRVVSAPLAPAPGLPAPMLPAPVPAPLPAPRNTSGTSSRSGGNSSGSSGRTVVGHTQRGRPRYAPRRYDEEF